ncbi:hypothetical protein SGFS_098240 [Streptomyces graminofaciens]|uniref:Uncharacterized protein n=1 Tax=Streptomyces graminofaciens TaxID=68212 RepID=A0ABM7FPG5_9ACTN|nr:hypothetical protein SGFS_098240 [Streptomyces graminofaciens]
MLRDELIKSMQDLPEHTFPSVEQLAHRHRDPEDSFDLGAFDSGARDDADICRYDCRRRSGSFNDPMGTDHRGPCRPDRG